MDNRAGVWFHDANKEFVMTGRPAQPLSEIAANLTLRTIDGVSVRFVESDQRDVDALLLSPWPESVFAYEAIWSGLVETTHVVAIDLPGFGRSEGTDALMTPRAMGEFIVRAADAFGLEKPHAVGPDIGTSAALFAAASHPERFLSLVVGTGGVAVPIQLGDPLREWVFAQDLEPYRRIGGRAIVVRALGTLERYEITDAARQDYLASYEGNRFADSIRYVQSYPTELEALQAVLPHVQTPVQIISGRRDPVVPLVNAEYLHERLPHSELHLIDASHFIWEDAADEYAALLTAWWAEGFQRCMKRSIAVACGS
jgi:pimeloyl-ACP methyl ester carboxylesterase